LKLQGGIKMPRVEKGATLLKMTVAVGAQLLWTAMKRKESKARRTTTTQRKRNSKRNTWSVIAT
jgi:hypothetical protein